MDELMIAGRVIRISDGLYCLNDLHKASGGEKRHSPHEWLRLAQTAELIVELEKEADTGITVSRKNQQVIKKVRGFGKQQGTFVCRELVYAYATWISPKFFLTVLRTFDAVVTGATSNGRPALLPLRAPRDYAEACALADEALREVNALNMRLARIRPWMRYWSDVFIEDALAMPPRNSGG